MRLNDYGLTVNLNTSRFKEYQWIKIPFSRFTWLRDPKDFSFELVYKSKIILRMNNLDQQYPIIKYGYFGKVMFSSFSPIKVRYQFSSYSKTLIGEINTQIQLINSPNFSLLDPVKVPPLQHLQWLKHLLENFGPK